MQRDVLRWIQSLDLSYPLKNPRRDLSNGFLAAEILSRYDKGVSLHSFDTGCAVARKYDNWLQIKKLLDKRSCKTISQEEIEAVIAQRPESARVLLEKLYTHLTHKELKQPIVATAPEGAPDPAVPPFARKTALALLRTKNDEMADRIAEVTGRKDIVTKEKQNDEMLVSHHVQWKAYRLTESERFKPKPRATSTAQTKNEKTPELEATKSKGRLKQMISKELTVRGVDEAVCQIFAQRDEIEREEAFRAGFDPDVDLGTSLSRVCYPPLQSFGVVDQLDDSPTKGRGAEDNSAIGSAEDSAERHRRESERELTFAAGTSQDYWAKFVEHRAKIGRDAKEATWRALNEAARNTAKQVIHRPSDAVHLTMGFAFLFTPTAVRYNADDPADDYDRTQALMFLRSVGRQLVLQNSDVAMQVIERYLLPVLGASLSVASAAKFEGIISVVLAFVNTTLLDDLKAVVGRLQLLLEATGGAHRFYAAAYFMLAEVDFQYCFGVDALCQYYSTAALTHAHPEARAAGLLLFELLAHHNITQALVVYPATRALAADPNWEVRACLLEAATKLAARALELLQEQVPEPPAPPTSDSPVLGTSHGMPSAPDADPESGTPSVEHSGIHTDGGALTERERLQLALPLLRETIEAAFNSFAGSSRVHRQLSLRILGPWLQVVDDGVLTAFIGRILEFSAESRAALLATGADRNGAAAQVLHGAVRCNHAVGGLTAVWNAPVVADGLLLCRDQHTAFDVLSILEPLVLSADLAGDPELWLNVIGEMKADISAALFDPSSSRGVSNSREMQFCTEMATAVVTKCYADLSGETIDDRSSFQDIQQLALDWFQASV